MKFWRNPEYQTLRSELTPEGLFLDRRTLMAATGALGAGTILNPLAADAAPQKPQTAGAPPATAAGAAQAPQPGASLTARKTSYAVADVLSSEDAVTGYNNFYEFGTDKSDPARFADKMTVSPWSVSVEGETDAPRSYGLRELVDYSKLEERVYRHRCVEAWSMVVPWVGVPMADVIRKMKPKASARFVQF